MLIPGIFTRFEKVRPEGRAIVPDHECILDVTAPRQKLTEWCWAAVLEGIFTAYQTANLQQCDIAMIVKKCPSCCRPRTTDKLRCCNKPLDDLKGPLGEHCGAVHNDPNERTTTFIKGCIDSGFPIAVRIAWTRRGAAHYVIIRGYRIMPGGGFEVHVSDPLVSLEQAAPMSFAEFLSNYKQDGEWDISYETTPHAANGLRRVPPVTPCR